MRFHFLTSSAMRAINYDTGSLGRVTEEYDDFHQGSLSNAPCELIYSFLAHHVVLEGIKANNFGSFTTKKVYNIFVEDDKARAKFEEFIALPVRRFRGTFSLKHNRSKIFVNGAVINQASFSFGQFDNDDSRFEVNVFKDVDQLKDLIENGKFKQHYKDPKFKQQYEESEHYFFAICSQEKVKACHSMVYSFLQKVELKMYVTETYVLIHDL